jgi:uncharacterized protein (UPF0276 family)
MTEHPVEITANLSDALIDLLAAGQAPIDGIEVGPWFSPREIRAYRQQLPGWPFYFHASSFLSRMRWMPGSIRRLKQSLGCTHSRWVSVHIELLPWTLYLLATRLGLYLPPPDAGKAKRRLCRDVARLARRVSLPVILENLPSLPRAAYAFEADPRIIADVVEQTGSGLLLDVAHARISAANQDLDVFHYLGRLPLERVVQIHVSGPRRRNGLFFDAHEALREEDWAILDWTLARTRPRVVTLEYFRQRRPLREQLVRLHEAVRGSSQVRDLAASAPSRA